MPERVSNPATMGRFCFGISLCLLLAGCLGMPEGVQPVGGFDADRYLGHWYEIARLDHSFERDLAEVTASYARRNDGAVRVINRGYNVKKDQWNDIEGVARFVGSESEAYLKVSFFGPFYGSYVVFELGRGAEDVEDADEAHREGGNNSPYDYAFVSGFNSNYLWLLARVPEVSEALKQRFIQRAKALGFATEELLWVEHGRSQNAP